ncbi:MAG: phosphatidylserine/phosphatidylglycerophosphate/cardiolipin synthase-like enzyme [Myxococcota bacterium]|jgi:phosphatidylserine/phosphatidylglycerophosphate/cardiolipin synthase-like enzyme
MGPPPLALVETAPTETTLNSPDIPDAHEVWLAMIRSATTSLDIAQFYVADTAGSRLSPVLAAVEAAAKRGVRVRILAEKIFYGQYPESLDHLGGIEGVTVRVWDAQASLGGILHAKYFLVDGKDAYLGSQNFDWRALEHVLELGSRVRQPVLVAALGDVFAVDWALAGGADMASALASHGSTKPTFPIEFQLMGDTAAVTPVASPKEALPASTPWDLPRLVALIDHATRTVRVQLLSYHLLARDGVTPFPDLDDALRRAAKRGVTVELMLGNWSQGGKDHAALTALQEISGITVKFVTIPEAKAGFIPFGRVIHAKLLVVDGAVAWLGTSNWGWDYFHMSRNVGLIVESTPWASRLDAFFLNVWDSDYAETLVPGRVYPKVRVAK